MLGRPCDGDRGVAVVEMDAAGKSVGSGVDVLGDVSVFTSQGDAMVGK